MKQFQTFKDGNTFFFFSQELCSDFTRCGGWSPEGNKPCPLMGSTEALRRDCGIFCLWATAVTSSATGMSWANGSFAFAVDFVSGYSKDLLMVAGLKSLDWWMEMTAGANWAHYPSLPFFTGGCPSHNTSHCCPDYLLKTPFCSILCLVYVLYFSTGCFFSSLKLKSYAHSDKESFISFLHRNVHFWKSCLDPLLWDIINSREANQISSTSPVWER